MKKETKINLTYNKPSIEAIKNFTEEAVLLYNQIKKQKEKKSA